MLFLGQIYKRIYRVFRFGRLRLLGKPFLLIKVGEVSLGYLIRDCVNRLLFLNRKPSIMRLSFGVSLYIPPGYTEAYNYILYEPEVTSLFSKFVQPGMIVVDIGAHLGYYTLLAKRKMGEKGYVFAFEPDPKFFYALKQSLELNGIKEGVYIYQMAVADKDGTASLFAHPSGSGSNLYASFSGSQCITVETITLDTFFEKLGWPKVDLIKIDAEGAELDVLKGMKELSQRCESLCLIVEFSTRRPSNIDPKEFFEALSELGFTRVFAIENPNLSTPEQIIKESERVGHLNLFCAKRSSHAINNVNLKR